MGQRRRSNRSVGRALAFAETLSIGSLFPPLWGRAGVGGDARAHIENAAPPFLTLPRKGGGDVVLRICGNTTRGYNKRHSANAFLRHRRAPTRRSGHHAERDACDKRKHDGLVWRRPH